jgi:hypothetical protein
MKQEEIYRLNISRPVNPAVSATKLDPDTEKIEIDEYVFTDEIMNGLYRILDAIKNNEPYDHVGIWIDGYYGSGKSHFLKYLDYCITPDTQEKALQHYLDAVKAVDPLDDSHNLLFDYDDLLSIASWVKKATVDTCIFNLETSYDQSQDKKLSFLQVFWNEFNGKRGFNKFNLSLAQNLEKPLQEKGVFEEFKKRIADLGGDWDNPSDAADIVDNELGMVLDIACELAPTLDKESIRKRIINRDTTVSIDRFGMELNSYLKDKDDNYRLIFLADEVSQFINNERDRYLNLQEIITKLSEACHNRVWVACTAQQDLSQLESSMNIVEERDKEGKIKGRFEVKVSLKGTQPEVITQKRILDKAEAAIPVLEKLYEEKSASFPLQFKLPNSYNAYDSEKDFVDYYPFVPYQFKLITQVFNSFLQLGYVATEIKGNERSIIKVIHATAKANRNKEVGSFISFDELYNNMFEEGLQAQGQRAFNNARDMALKYPADPKFAMRVANVLFMVCNISATDKLLFPASIDNITTLLINDVDTPRLNIKDKVEKVVQYLCDNNIIRREEGKKGAPDTFEFYSEEEMKVATLIANESVDNNTQAEVLRDVIFRYFSNLRNKETYKTRSFSVGVLIKGRSFLSNNPDITIEFHVDNDAENADQLSLINPSATRMIFFLGPQFAENKRLVKALYWYCQVNRYMMEPVTSKENGDIREEFNKRAKDQMTTLIEPEIHKILDSCPIITGMSVMDIPELDSKHGVERYHEAVQHHLANIYTKAGLVDNGVVPQSTDLLKKAILRSVQSGDYDGVNASLTPAEKEVDIYLNKQFGDANVSDVVAKFAKAPYGWNGICTLYVINELVRRHRRDYSYANNPHVDLQTVAGHIVTESNKFTLREAEVIPQDVVNQFIDAWKNIFGMMQALSSTDSSQLYRQSHDPGDLKSLPALIKSYNGFINANAAYPFVKPLKDAVEMFEEWNNMRDPVKFFTAVTEKQNEARQLNDTCKEVIAFIHDQLDRYKELLRFIRSNEDNFQFVPDEQQDYVVELKSLETKEWPISIREYVKLKNTVTAILDTKRKEIKENIVKVYNETFDLLEKSADEQGVPRTILTSRKNTIDSKTAPTNILLLMNNLNTDALFTEESAKIIQKAKELHRKTLPDGSSVGEDKPDDKIRTQLNMTLRTRTTKPLTNEHDVDEYLQRIKQQLMDMINKGFDITVVK